MKTLNDNYSASHGSSQETFADLMFCALVVLVLFVMALAFEVSQRIRADLALLKPPTVVEVGDEDQANSMKQEFAHLSAEVQQKHLEVESLQLRLRESNSQIELQKQEIESQIAAAAEMRLKHRELEIKSELQKQEMESQVAAMRGEQRFTGAREPASLMLAYNYAKDRFYFVSARDLRHAVLQWSNESIVEHIARVNAELAAIARQTKKQRGFSMEEAQAIYQGFTRYKEVESFGNRYRVVDSILGITYNPKLCGDIAGDQEVMAVDRTLIETKIGSVGEAKGEFSEEMYPKATLQIDVENRYLTLNGVQLSPKDAREILLSLDGRGAMIDLDGFTGPAPEWLMEEVLIPAGYIARIPKL